MYVLNGGILSQVGTDPEQKAGPKTVVVKGKAPMPLGVPGLLGLKYENNQWSIVASEWVEIVLLDAYGYVEDAAKKTNNFGRGYRGEDVDIWGFIEWVNPGVLRMLESIGVGPDLDHRAGWNWLVGRRINARWWANWDVALERKILEHRLIKVTVEQRVWNAVKPELPDVIKKELKHLDNAFKGLAIERLAVGLLFAIAMDGLGKN